MAGGALDQLTAHFERMRGRSFMVDLGGTQLEVFADPITLRQRELITARAGTDDAKVALWTTILLAKDAQGQRLFSDDAATVQRLSEEVPAEVVAQIAAGILQVTGEGDLGN